MTTAKALDPTTQYAIDVAEGRLVAGDMVVRACRRHLDDLAHQAERGLAWREDEAQAAFEFFELVLCLPEETASDEAPAADAPEDPDPIERGTPFILRPWQKFIVGSLFGWYTTAGPRRFRTAYVETGKGSGKTPLAAGIALYLLVADGERGAQVYAAATKIDQAKLSFTDAERMVQASPDLRALVDQKVNNLAVLETGSFFRPISSEKRGLDGKRVHGAVIDELHEHPTAIVVDKIRAGTKGRRNALIFEITNSGYDRHSVCWNHHEYSRQVLEGVTPNDSWFAYVCQLDPGDDWKVEGPHWLKANPNLGVSLPWQYLRDQVREAVGMPSKQNIVRRLNFCEWTEQAERWLDLPLWDAGAVPVDVDALRGRACYLGLDLSSVRDLSALALVFPDEDGAAVDVEMKFWVPEDELHKRVQRDHVPYDVWLRDGHLEATPGNVIDYDHIRAAVLAAVETYDVRELGYDPWNATQLITQLTADGVACFPVRQGFGSMSAPTKLLEKLVLGQQLRHGGQPVLRWNASNVAIEQDAAGNIKPSKPKSTERIDGIVAIVNALDRASRHDGDGPLWFESHGVVTA